MDEQASPQTLAPDGDPAEREHESDEGEATEDEATEDEGGDDGAGVSIEELGLPMPVLAEDDALDLLVGGELSIVGRLWVSSNNAMLGTVTLGGLTAACIYKPVVGERPLADFPDGTLARREVAAFLASSAWGLGVVPPTVLRDGPYGEGMVQLWIRPDPEADPIAMVNDADVRLRRIALFDAVINNTDRKAGHLLPVPGGRVYGVDHGVTFSPVPKLRTVLWHWRGEPFTGEEAALLTSARAAIGGDVGRALQELLDPIEVRATARRLDRLMAAGAFPQPDPRWPAIPWPPV